MVKHLKRLCILALVVLLLPVLALAELPAVVDNASLFTADEISQMETIILRIRKDYQMDAVVVTSNDVPKDYSDDGKITQQWADGYYDLHGYGIGDDHSGVLYLIDMNNRFPCISTMGTLADYITDDRLDGLFDRSSSFLSAGRYGQAAIQVLTTLEGYLHEGRIEGSFRYDSETGERLSGIYNALTTGELLVGFGIGLFAALLFYLSVAKRYSLSGSTYSYNAVTACKRNFAPDQEIFLREHVTRHRTPPPSSSSSSGGGSSRPGGGRGVSIHSGGHGGGVGRHF